MRGAVTGYAYNAPSGDGVVDITFVGYVTPTSNGGPLRRTTIFDATSTSCDTSANPARGTYRQHASRRQFLLCATKQPLRRRKDG